MNASRSLLKPLSALEHDYNHCVRNLDVATIAVIENNVDLPPEYSGPEHFKVQTAHRIYAQIRARQDGVDTE